MLQRLADLVEPREQAGLAALVDVETMYLAVRGRSMLNMWFGPPACSIRLSTTSRGSTIGSNPFLKQLL